MTTGLVPNVLVHNADAPTGFLNPTIYPIAVGKNYNNDFHDIAVGDNYNSGSPSEYPAVVGYDLVTGWGSPNGQSLINELAPSRFNFHFYYYAAICLFGCDYWININPPDPEYDGGLSGVNLPDGFHIYYASILGQINQIFNTNSGGWGTQNMSSLAGSTTKAAAGTALGSFAIGTTQHVCFTASNQHVHQLYWDNTRWRDQDLTGYSGGVPTAPGSGLSCQSLADGQHYYFVATNKQVHQLFYDGNRWTDQNLSSLARSSTLAGAGASLTSFGIGTTQHVCFVATNQHVHQMYWDNSRWRDQDLTGYVNDGVLAAAGTGLSCFSGNDGQHFYFVATNQHVHELFYNDSWVDKDLTQIANGALAISGTGVSGYAIGSDQYVYFVANNQLLYRLSWDGSLWRDQDLTA